MKNRIVSGSGMDYLIADFVLYRFIRTILSVPFFPTVLFNTLLYVGPILGRVKVEAILMKNRIVSGSGMDYLIADFVLYRFIRTILSVPFFPTVLFNTLLYVGPILGRVKVEAILMKNRIVSGSGMDCLIADFVLYRFIRTI